MWDGDPVGVDLKRPMWAFAVVSVLCTVLMVLSAGSGSAVKGLFHAPKPISSGSAPTGQPVPETEASAEAAASSRVVSVPPELTAHPVGQALSGKASSGPAPLARTTTAGKADRKADRAGNVTGKATAKVDRKADKAADKAAKKAAKAQRKADRAAAKAARKADQAAAKAAR